MLKIGILGGADIAFRNFIPSLKDVTDIECVGVASNSLERREKFSNEFGIPSYSSYNEIINDPDIDAIYLPLPPSLHYSWGKKVLESGKHLFLEKPSTTSYSESKELVSLATNRGLVIQENYMFQYHSQLKYVQDTISSGRVGDIKLFRSSFCFPFLGDGNFRYNKELGGGALLDAGGYIVKLANLLLGDSIKLLNAEKSESDGLNVDIGGIVSFTNDDGVLFQGYYGMDNYYQCTLEVFGSIGKLSTNRIFTAPASFAPTYTIDDSNGQEIVELEADGHFKNSIDAFYTAVNDNVVRLSMANDLLKQASLVEQVVNQWQE